MAPLMCELIVCVWVQCLKCLGANTNQLIDVCTDETDSEHLVAGSAMDPSARLIPQILREFRNVNCTLYWVIHTPLIEKYLGKSALKC